jgi:hypothetical protein
VPSGPFVEATDTPGPDALEALDAGAGLAGALLLALELLLLLPHPATIAATATAATLASSFGVLRTTIMFPPTLSFPVEEKDPAAPPILPGRAG